MDINKSAIETLSSWIKNIRNKKKWYPNVTIEITDYTPCEDDAPIIDFVRENTKQS